MGPVGLIRLLLVGVTLAVFYRVLDFPFLSYDDFDYILRHPQVQAGLTLDSVIAAFTTPYRTAWHPLTILSLQIDHELWGNQSSGYHLTNLLLHQGSVLLLFVSLARMTGAHWRSAFVAAVFAIHPLHVESVAWAAERKDVLSGLFWMLTLYFYMRHFERPGGWRYAGVLISLTLGLMAKPMLVTLPFALLLLDYWPLGRFGPDPVGRRPEWRRVRPVLLEKLPMFALVAVVSVITLNAQRSGGAMGHLVGLTLPLRIANAVEAYGFYVWKTFWPTRLAVFYPHPLDAISTVWVAVSGAALILISTAVVVFRRSQPYLPMGWFWFLGTLVPVIGIVQVGLQARADRYTYVPQIGLAIMVAWGVAEALRRLRVGRMARIGFGSVAILLLAGMSWLQVGYWRGSVPLFQHALAVTEGNYIAYGNLATAALRNGRLMRAERHARNAVHFAPWHLASQLTMVDVLKRQGNLSGLIERYHVILETAPDVENIESIHHDLAFTLLRVGRYAEARRHLEQVRRANPELPHVYVGLGMIDEHAGRLETAARNYRTALEKLPNMRFAANPLARLLLRCETPSLCDPEEAARITEAALNQLDADDPILLDTLAEAQLALGRASEARNSLTRAAQARVSLGGDPEARDYPIEQMLRELNVAWTW